MKVRYLHEYGGHFPAWENPELLASDIRKFFGDEDLSNSLIFREEGYSAPVIDSILFTQGWDWLLGGGAV